MKLLSIGNSFSQDAHNWLHKLAKANGFDIETVNLYIGGCDLKKHWENFVQDIEGYDLEQNGGVGEAKISIAQALTMENWDVITLQQVSHLSGIPETYEPYLTDLAKAVKNACPGAALYFHQTWAYERDSGHSGFANYGNDQQKMYDCILPAASQVAASIGATIIPAGEAVQACRQEIPEFDYQNGGLSLCRDGFHLSLDYGRFIAAAVWLRTLTGQAVQCDAFENFDPQLLQKILAVVNKL